MKLNINGIDKEVSKEICALAVTDYFAKHPEPKPKPKYQFREGDMAKNQYGGTRIIVKVGGEIKSFDLQGHWQGLGQDNFESLGYVKIGVLKDFITE